MPSSTYGYVVELDDGKTMTERFESLRSAGVPSGNIVVEKTDRENRPQLKRLIKRICSGDTLTFESIYGLGHNYSAIAENLEHIRHYGDVSVVLLDMPALRGADPAKRAATSDLVMDTVLYMARHQKESRDYQQRKGIDSARARGVQFGRPKLDMPTEFDAVVAHWRNGDLTAEDAARLLNISRSTFFRRAKANVD